MTDKETIHYSSEKAATRQTVTGWVSANGRFWGEDEHMARWDGCTHVACKECGAPVLKNCYCSPCHERRQIEKFKALPVIDWDRETPVYSESHDRYFMDPKELLEYTDDEQISLEDLMLVICTPNHAHEVNQDYWCDDLPEDGELPAEISEALDALNLAISKAAPLSWSPGKQAINVDSLREQSK